MVIEGKMETIVSFIIFTIILMFLLFGIYGFMRFFHDPLRRCDREDHEVKSLYGVDFTVRP
jgi:hypothetical protein